MGSSEVDQRSYGENVIINMLLSIINMQTSMWFRPAAQHGKIVTTKGSSHGDLFSFINIY